MPDGYHKIQTVLQEIPEIHDEIKIQTTKKTATHNPQNLAYKALQLLKKTYKIKKFARITIKKNIPISSGLGGAASDAAAVLKGLNKLWNLKLSQKKLLALAAKLGKDVPFFIIGGTALGTNYGEKIKSLKPIKNIKFKIFPKSSNKSAAVPASGVAGGFSPYHHPRKTAKAYQSLDLPKCNKNSSKTKKLLKAIQANDTKNILKNLHNDFEQLYKIKPQRHLCGAGPSTFIARPKLD